ncbi:glycoside hydrolase family 18 protein [Sphingomonas sp. HITSZ_GF]|uniref:glycosyl hydrolase family 18 protein n=1 Tax=Sphingomonas sp. HITSZ_GF TaxID=3037247 RepID=UPI00240D7022|nr:glycoside hydrolase family 18 protein [Sphingomonas sp. HITSZ_GF]MDG2532040.1 glycoside hydrolase family 18 protein [Sphingomonas sp. HITSZ_GF]
MTRFPYLFAPMLFLSACGGGGGGGGVVTPAPSSSPTATPTVTITVTPATAALTANGSQQFACAVSGATDAGCTWTVQEANGGTVSATGLYVAPGTAGTFHVVARSVADTGKTASATVTVSLPTAARPWVTGYYLGYFWDNSYPPERVDMTALTHYVFGRVAPGGGTLDGAPGTVVEGAGTAHEPRLSPDGVRSVEDYLVKRAHDAGRKALLMIGGASDGNGFLLSTTNAIRSTFVKNVVDYMVAHDYDGLDLDWEDKFEGSDEITPHVSGDEAKRRLFALIADLRTEFAKRPRYQGAGKAALLTLPGYTVSINDLGADGKVPQWQADLANKVDQYNLMSYGIGTTWSGNGWLSWFSSPIFGATGQTPRDLNSSIIAYEKTGVPRSKIGIGIGFYGIYFGPGVTGPRQDTEANNIFEYDDDALRYSELVRMGYLSNGTYKWDEVAQVGYRSYAGGGYTPPGSGRNKAGFLSYEDERSIAAKAAWVRQAGLGGTILWAINYDYLPNGTSPLLSAVKTEFKPEAP